MDPADSTAERSTSTRLPPGDFGVVLATLRARRGWSVREFARRANVSEGQICNLESGLRNPTPAVATACDAALGTGGELVELAGAGRCGARTEGVVEAGPVVTGYERVLLELKDIGRSTGPRFVTASMKSISRTLTDAGPHAVGEQRAEIWLLASRFAEYAGWMAQEAGNPAEALRWTNLAVRWGAHGGDETVAAYALVRKAFIAQHRGDTCAAIGFADQAAGHPAANPVIRAHAARRAAQGHARRGDAEACQEALERFRSHAVEAIGDRTPHWGPRIENGNPRLIEASCMLSLRRFELAADLFAAEHRQAVPADSNSQARFSVRQATALAGAGHLDDACQIVEATLPVIKCIDSATVRAELGRFVEQARTRRASPGQLALIDASAALSIG
ncbi:multiprotein-bridging factor 1 family protein [Streptomyces sp. NPDC093099]|uniref:helix-turn-helix domain-containing protein n=1 Tax=Streptomyces sp. NPDC093099 TaxID=3366028 RepID=UPI00382CE461